VVICGRSSSYCRSSGGWWLASYNIQLLLRGGGGSFDCMALVQHDKIINY
jgi:hypothetical protein